MTTTPANFVLRAATTLSLAWILFLGSPARAAGPEQSPEPICCSRCEPRPQDEVWLVNARGLGCPSGGAPDLRVSRFDPASKEWIDASLGEIQSAPPMPLMVYVHGNRVEDWEALSLGWEAYCGLARTAGEAPFRFVIWSWPSAQIRGPIKDARLKADRADSHAWYLGWFLNQMPEEQPIGLVGFSYGGRVITGALDALGGGTVAGRTLDLPAAKEGATKTARLIRAVLMSPAVDSCWLCPGGCEDRAADASERLLVFYNPCDPALKRFRVTDKCSKPDALGYTGLPCNLVLASGASAEEFNTSGYVGREHNSYTYLRSSTLMRMTREVVLP